MDEMRIEQVETGKQASNGNAICDYQSVWMVLLENEKEKTL